MRQGGGGGKRVPAQDNEVGMLCSCLTGAIVTHSWHACASCIARASCEDVGCSNELVQGYRATPSAVRALCLCPGHRLLQMLRSAWRRCWVGWWMWTSLWGLCRAQSARQWQPPARNRLAKAG